MQRDSEAAIQVQLYCLEGCTNLKTHPVFSALPSWANPPLRLETSNRFEFRLPNFYRPTGAGLDHLFTLFNKRIAHFLMGGLKSDPVDYAFKADP